MTLLPVTFDIISQSVDEKLSDLLTPEENVKSLAFQKAEVIAEQYPNNLVIGCDTLVALGNEIMGKPKNPENAKSMLSRLSNKEHNVYTGVSMLNIKEGINICFSEVTKVKMKSLTQQEIDDYIATGEPLDKAGAYGIQGQGAIYIEKIEGDYYNVVGLPLCRVYQELMKINKS